ncbi:hypothetical protein [Luteipulveratus halotolerans]|uniref:hypothetical protein n=1 Tax=Luteipulveratus halotolerans TaxID=1631356 RepID=UPI0012FA64BF|nr:hypothetical protein [Luteipulveratus halotolerans]
MIDSDQHRIIGTAPSCTNIIMTTWCDMETEIAFSNDQKVLQRVIRAHFDNHAFERVLGNSSMLSMGDAVAEILRPVSLLRMASRRDGLGLNISSVPIHEVISGSPAKMDLERFYKIVCAKSKDSPMSPQDVSSIVSKEIRDCQIGSSSICNGHDFVAAVGKIGALATQEKVGAKVLERSLRAAFDCESLRSTALYADVAEWSERNSTKVWVCGQGRD